MYYVYLIALSAFICAVVLCGIGALLFFVIPYRGVKSIGSHMEYVEYDSWWAIDWRLNRPRIKEKEVKDYKECLVMPINDESDEGSTSRMINSFTMVMVASFMLLVSIITGIGGGISMARAEADYYKYADIYNMYYTMYDNGQDLANIGFTQKVISYNNWLVGARANLETYGRYSKWYGYDLYSLKYITMRGEE